MTSMISGAVSRANSVRDAFLLGTALSSSMMFAHAAWAQNVTYSGPGDYTLANTGTIAGGPRTVDVAVNFGNIDIDVNQVEVTNNGGTTGAGVAASNTGPGSISIAANKVTASGTGPTNGIDARGMTGTITIDSGTVNSNLNISSRGIQATSAGGNIVISAVETNGGQRGIFTGSNAGVFPDSTTITSTLATASGVSQPNAIVGQGQTVRITSGTSSNSNAAGNSGTAIFANAGTGGAFVTSSSAQALGNNQSAIQVFSDSTVELNSTFARTTQSSDGLSVQSGTAIAITSGAVETTGSFGARGIVLGGSGNGINYASATVTSGSITTTGANSYGIFVTPTTGATTIASTSIATQGQNAHGIYITPIGTGVLNGAVAIDGGTVTTAGDNAVGIFVNNSAGAVAISAASVSTGGQRSNAIDIRPASASTAPVVVSAGIVRATGAFSSGIIVGPAAGSASVTVADVAVTGVAVDARAKGDVTLVSGVARSGAGNTGLVAISQDGTVTLNSADLVVGGATALFAQGRNSVTVNSGTLTVTGAGQQGIFAQTASPTAAGTVSVTSGALSSAGGGISIVAGISDAVVANTGSITTTGSVQAIRTATTAGATAITSNSIDTSGIDGVAIAAFSDSGSIAIDSTRIATAGVGAQGIFAQTANGDVAITSGEAITTGTGFNANTGQTSDSIAAIARNGSVTISSGNSATSGDFANAIFASASGPVSIASDTASGTGAGAPTILATSKTADLAITAGSTSATGEDANGIQGIATLGNLTISAGTARAAQGDAVNAAAGSFASVNAQRADAQGDGHAGVVVTGGTGVALDIAEASSTGTAIAAGTTVTRADAIFAVATNGTIVATIGSASAMGTGSDAVRLIANGTGGAVSTTVIGTVAAASGTGLFIDPPGAVTIAVARGASIAGLTGIATTGGSNAITNLGTVTGTAGPGILASGPTTLVNDGSIAGPGSLAVQLGAADDRVTLLTGSSVSGRIVGGGGTDAAILSGTGNGIVAGFDEFSSLSVQSGYWTADASNPGNFGSAAIAAGASLELANGAAGIAGLTAPVFINDGTLVVRSSAVSAGSTFGAAGVTGSGTTVLTGAGNVTLDGTDAITNSGGIAIGAGSRLLVTGMQGGAIAIGAGGTLQVGDGAAAGSVTGSVSDAGVLIVNRSDDFTFAAALTGSGSFLKQGAGKVIFGANYAFTGETTVQQGSIKLSTAFAPGTQIDLEGSGQLDLSGTVQTVAALQGSSTAASINIDAGALTVNQDTNTLFAGSIVGAGTLAKSGPGTLNLTGTSTYTGPTTVGGGTLAVNGSIASPVSVISGGTLGGTGRVGSVTIGSGGTYAPGNSIGTQTVAGNVTFAAGSIFAVEANAAGQADRINATGTATLAGGTVQVLAQAGTYNRFTDYTILTAAGGVSGKFAAVSSHMAFLSPLLSYSATAVSLTLARNDIAFGTFAASPNQAAVAGAISARGLGDPVFNIVLFQSAAGAQATFDQLSGELHASLGSELIAGERMVREAVLNRSARAEDGSGVWLQGFQAAATSRTQPGVSRLRSNRTGAVGGLDFASSAGRIGIHGGYQDVDVKLRARGDTANVKTAWLGANAALTAGNVTIQVGGDYAWHNIETSRIITVPGLAATAMASPDARSIQLYGEASAPLTHGAIVIAPFVRNTYIWSKVDGFAENGGIGGLAVAEHSRGVDIVSLGLRADGDQPISGSATFTPRMSIAYETAFGDRKAASTALIGGRGPSFEVAGTALGRNALTIDAEAGVTFGSGLRIGAGVFGTASRKWSDFGAKASLAFRF